MESCLHAAAWRGSRLARKIPMLRPREYFKSLLELLYWRITTKVENLRIGNNIIEISADRYAYGIKEFLSKLKIWMIHMIHNSSFS